MLQQTQVSRVIPSWHRFIRRWPEPAACAAADLAEVLRLWQGLGYPRRALALHRIARHVSEHGWPGDEVTLRRLPSVGPYTARALLVLAMDGPSRPPCDVNVSRVAARAALGLELHEATAAQIEAAVASGLPRGMSRRDYTLALFDAGALHCRARARCDGCPLRRGCVSRSARRRTPAQPPSRRRPRYEGSFRAVRGAVLRAALAGEPVQPAPLAEAALASLVADGLLPPRQGGAPPG